VGKASPESPKEAFVADMVALISRCCEAEIDAAQHVTVKERLGGKYVSVAVDVVVRAPEIITNTYELIGRDSRVKMKF
jgi:putative lipoic acid-binding regulatory protein